MAGPEVIETGDAPIKAWIEGVPVEDAARHQLRNVAALPFIHQPRRGDAGRALRHGRDGRLGDPDQGRDHAGRGRRRHRLRHDGGAHDADGQRSARQPARLRSAIEAAVPHGGIGLKGGWKDGVPNAVGAPRSPTAASADGLQALDRQAPAASREAQSVDAARHARRRQPLHRGLPRRGGPRVGDAALGLARHRQPHRHVLHRGARSAGHARSSTRPCRTRTSPASRRASRCSTTTSRRSAGRRTTRAPTAR